MENLDTLDTLDPVNVADAAQESAAAKEIQPETSNLQPAGASDVLTDLESFFEAQEPIAGASEQVDNQSELLDEQDSPDDSPSEEDAAADDDGEPEAESAQADADDELDPETDAADFDALEAELNGEKPAEEDEATAEGESDQPERAADDTEFPDIEALKAKYPRQSKAFYEEAAKLSAQAKATNEVIAELGGSEQISALKQIATGIKTGKSTDVFSGLYDASGEEAVKNIIGDSVLMTIVKSKEFKSQAEKPELVAFGESLEQVGNEVFQARFGEGMTFDRIEKFAELQKIGWLEALPRWIEQGYVDSDEWYELVDAAEAPAGSFSTLTDKVKSLETQLAEKSAETSRVTARETETNFRQATTSQLDSVLSGVVWKTSVLRDHAGDSEELKGDKSFLRSRLRTDALEILEKAAQEKDEATGKSLLDLFAESPDSDDYKTKATNAVKQAVLKTREQTARAERIVAKLYGKTRNGSIGQARPKKLAGDTKKPTVEPEANQNRVKTADDIVKEFEQFYLRQGL